MNEINFRHVGYIVKDLRSAVSQFKLIFDLTDFDIQIFPAYGEETPSRFAFFKASGVEIELIEPISDHFKKILFGSGVGINHICFTVKDMDTAYQHMVKKGIRPGHVTPHGVITMPHRKLVYFNPEDTGGFLIEYIQDL